MEKSKPQRRRGQAFSAENEQSRKVEDKGKKKK